MRSTLRCAGVMLVMVMLVTAFASGQQVPKDTPKAQPATQQSGELAGKVSMVGGSSKTLTVVVEQQVYEPNPAFQNNNNRQVEAIMRRQMEIQRDMAAVAQARNRTEAMRRMQELQRDMAQLQLQLQRLNVNPGQAPFKVVTKNHDYEIATDENTKVRFATPPAAFDDKGNVKKYTDAELKELKGPDPKVVGYKGDFEQLRPGHEVRIAIGKKAATKGKDLDKAAEESDKPYAVLILVTGEGPVPGKKKGK